VIRWKKIRRFGRIIVLGNLLIIGALAACLEYPVFRLKTVEVAYADGREVSAEVHQRVCRAAAITPDLNLFNLPRQEIAEALLQDEDIARVVVHIGLPDRLQVRLYTAEPLIWWANHPVTPLAGDGMPVSTAAIDKSSSYPLGAGNPGGDDPYARWQLVEFYQRLIEYDARWADVISQISGGPDNGWELVLNKGGERILLNGHPDSETLDRLVRFLENVPEVRWENGKIDARFNGSIILTPQRGQSRRGHISDRAAGRDLSHISFGGRS
jgi:cell division septal protein FtsQ